MWFSYRFPRYAFWIPVAACFLAATITVGCAHGDVIRPNQPAQMCPAEALSADANITPAPPVLLPMDHHYTRNVNQRIKSLRRDLSACYVDALAYENTSGMFIADIFIDDAGIVSRIQFLRASIYKELPVLGLTTAMMECFRDVLSSVAYPANRHNDAGVRIYFLGYQMPGLTPALNPHHERPAFRGYIMNTREAARMHPDKLPNRFTPLYNGKGFLSTTTIWHSEWQNRVEYNWCFNRERWMKRYLRGVFNIRILVSPYGAVLRSEAVNADLDSAFVLQCIAKVMGDAEFPPNPNGLYTFTYLHFNYDWW